MKNKHVGFIVIGVALLVGFLVWLFNRALTQIVNDSCSHGPTCPMWGSIKFQTNVGLGVLVLLVLIGLYLVFFAKEKEVKEIHIKHINQIQKEKVVKKDYSKILETLHPDEKSVFQEIIKSDGSIFQSQLVENLQLSKVKVTRILDRLEGKGLIERKRRGMTNVVLLKH